MAAEKLEATPFITAGLAPPDDALRNLSLENLCRFFANPAKYFLRNRLGIVLGEEGALLDDAEPFEVGGLEKYAMEQDLMESVMTGGRLESLFPKVKASGLLPHGTPGEAAFKGSGRRVEAFAKEVRRYLRSDRLAPLEVHLDLAGFQLTGRIHPIHRDRLVRYRHAGLKARDHLDLWIPHLVLNVTPSPNIPRESTLIGLEKGRVRAVHYGPLPGAEETLVQLLELYWQGLTEPLRFFPETSLEYARLTLGQGKSAGEALGRVANTWEGSEFRRGESMKPHLELCFKDMDPLDQEFQRLSELVFRPMLAARTEISADG
jgi:exodeoxyribonuclease V gamma subunit